MEAQDRRSRNTVTFALFMVGFLGIALLIALAVGFPTVKSQPASAAFSGPIVVNPTPTTSIFPSEDKFRELTTLVVGQGKSVDGWNIEYTKFENNLVYVNIQGTEYPMLKDQSKDIGYPAVGKIIVRDAGNGFLVVQMWTEKK